MSSTAAPPAAPAIDWADWRIALERFSAATGLCVSAYDEAGQRQAGPFASSRVARLLMACGVWGEGRAADTIERALIARVRASGKVEHELVLGELRVQASPLASGSSIVYGWAFQSFGTALGCARLARELGCEGVRLWAEARLESPVSEARFAVYTELLETLIASSERHRQAIERLHELGRVREVFLAGVSHELRTPLSVLATRIELLLRSKLDDPGLIRASLEQMKRHVGEEARLVEDLLETSRTRTGQLTIERTRVSLGEVLRSAIASVQPHAQARGVELSAPALDDAQLELFADAHRLQQVFWNLLSNAVKFTPAGGRVTLALSPSGAHVRLVVSDTGRGIRPEFLSRVFERFSQADDPETRGVRGLGIGLAIVRELVEAHGGQVSVRSTESEGTTFTVLLPRDARTSARGGLSEEAHTG